MTEATAITIDNIVKLVEEIAQAEYQRGYANGLEEKRLTEKHWGKKPEKSCETCVHLTEDIKTCGFPFKCADKQWYKSREDKTE